MELYHEETQRGFEYTLGWLRQWACSQSVKQHLPLAHHMAMSAPADSTHACLQGLPGAHGAVPRGDPARLRVHAGLAAAVGLQPVCQAAPALGTSYGNVCPA